MKYIRRFEQVETDTSPKMFKVSYSAFIMDAYDDGDSVIIPRFRTINEDEVNKRISKDDPKFKIMVYYSAKLKSPTRINDTGMIHDLERNFADFTDELIARPAHNFGETKVYNVRNRDGEGEFFTEDEIDVDFASGIKYKSNWDEL